MSLQRRERLAHQFAAEPAYSHVGLRLTRIEPGFCCSQTPIRPELLHHRGAVQGGLVAMVADATAGYAALATLAEDDEADDMATVEFKTSFFGPVAGEAMICRAEAAFAGGSLVFARAEVLSETATGERVCAEATLTFKRLRTGA